MRETVARDEVWWEWSDDRWDLLPGEEPVDGVLPAEVSALHLVDPWAEEQPPDEREWRRPVRSARRAG